MRPDVRETGGNGMRVLVANYAIAYREAISIALKRLRPRLEVFAAEPEDLDWVFVRLSPQLVVCSRVTELVEREALSWIELYPDHASESVVLLAGRKSLYPEMDFYTLLSVLDEAGRLYETAQKKP